MKTTLAAFATVVAIEGTAAACPMYSTYSSQVWDNTVVGHTPEHCDYAHPATLMRENLDTGEVVRLPMICESSGGHWVDLCVEPGRYRYGLGQEIDCACGRYPTHGDVTIVEHPLEGMCSSWPQRLAYDQTLAWSDGKDYTCERPDASADAGGSVYVPTCKAGCSTGGENVEGFWPALLALAFIRRRRP